MTHVAVTLLVCLLSLGGIATVVAADDDLAPRWTALLGWLMVAAAVIVMVVYSMQQARGR